ncbi:hypothetical protein FA15DRAFT_702754 [Coprinopsis marcescibilis]|uniref:Uncharacterized protein n=1 Tax=Coprinopsis marcescibilis TaxID=230819 RepID=A0A5C3L119_COPMA|nr:hypothetical protein FA15DRAFT_702754 [Coprinopsis marcescibilis]
MPPHTTAIVHTPSSSSSTSSRPRKRRWTREQVLKNLQLLDGLDNLLPPALPPSPPASRSASPVPGFKRKSESSSDSNSLNGYKRPRNSSMSDRRSGQSSAQQPHQNSHHPLQAQPPHSLQPPSAQPTPATTSASSSGVQGAPPSRLEPEEGELREESSLAVQAPSIPAPPKASIDVPIRRPKRGKLGLRHFDSLHDTYHNQGRMLKYSGDARFWSTYAPTHREYRPLPDPPPPNSPYHKHGGLIARLELVDALVCFTYSIWNRDYGRRSCNKETWGTIEAFLIWCKQKWQAEEGINDAEKAFIGLIWMIEAFIHGRKLMYTVRDHLDADTNNVTKSMKGKIAAVAEAVENGAGPNGSLQSSSMGTPTMLPSPASIAPANSANSTPTYRDNSTPSQNVNSRQATQTQQPQRPPRIPSGPSPVPVPLLPPHLANSHFPIPQLTLDAMAKVTEPIGPILAQDLRDFVAGYHAASWCMSTSQTTLNLPIMMRCFPTTFNRMMHTTLLPTEEHEPDFEDEDGELFWPGQLVSGEGLGWVCLMGKAMIKEFGKAYGYIGIDGVVPKPKPEDDVSSRTNATGTSSSSHAHR